MSKNKSEATTLKTPSKYLEENVYEIQIKSKCLWQMDYRTSYL